MWDSGDTFRMRLSSAERLAKELKPAFICVLKVNDQLEFVSAFLIHLFGDPLKVILQRLRAEEKKKAFRLNMKYIYMDVTKVGQPIEATGEALRAALSKFCGKDPHQYVEAKRAQLKELGFEPGAYRTEMTLQLDNPEDLVDVFLGLKKGVNIANVRTFETRFGIELPAQPSFNEGGKFSLDPKPFDRCVVAYRRQRLVRPAVFEGQMVFAPRFVTQTGKMAVLIRTDFFNIRYANSTFVFRTYPEVFETLRLPLRQWQSFMELGLGLAESEGEIQIKPDRLPNILKLPIHGQTFEGMEQGFFVFFIRVLEKSCEDS